RLHRLSTGPRPHADARTVHAAGGRPRRRPSARVLSPELRLRRDVLRPAGYPPLEGGPRQRAGTALPPHLGRPPRRAAGRRAQPVRGAGDERGYRPARPAAPRAGQNGYSRPVNAATPCSPSPMSTKPTTCGGTTPRNPRPPT